MPSRKQSTKSAKTAASKKADAAKLKRTTAKATTAKAAAKTKTSKVKSVSASKTKTASAAKTKAAAAKTTKTSAAKTAASKAKSAAAKAAAAKAAVRKAAAAKTAAAKAAAAKPSAGKAAAAKSKAKAATSARTPVKATAKPADTRKAAAVAKSVKDGAAMRAPKPTKSKTDKSRVAVAVKEATQEKAKQPQIKKAVDNIKTIPATEQKPVEQAGVRAKVQLVRSETAAPVAAAAPAPTPVRAAPDPRPASPAPAMQPRETSEQNPVTQKKITSPAPAPAAAKPAPAKAPAPEQKPAKPASQKLGFKTHEHIVYPAHGVGQIIAIEEQEVAGFKLELFVISFVKDKMILKVPTPKVVSVGMRKLAEGPVITKSLDTLTGRARIKRTMWSRRAQEYEAKINSGDLIAIAEVVRDLYRSEAQPEQSYSERQLYEAALDRMSRELSVVQKITEQESLKLIEAQLQKGPRRAAKSEADGESDTGDIEEAA